MSHLRRRTRTDEIVIHHTATPPDMDIGVKEIRAWHVERGFADVGYHRVIRRDGTVEQGRPDWAVGAHVKGHNWRSYGVAVVGGREAHTSRAEANYTYAQLESLRWEINRALDDTMFPDADVVRHGDLDPENKASCPLIDLSGYPGYAGTKDEPEPEKESDDVERTRGWDTPTLHDTGDDDQADLGEQDGHHESGDGTLADPVPGGCGPGTGDDGVRDRDPGEPV